MKTARRYLAKAIYRSTLAVLLVLIGLFSFFDMIENLDNLSKTFTFVNLLGMQLIGLPRRVYELLPIALLIGAIVAIANLVQRNEISILRVSGVSSKKFVGNLWLISIPVMLLALVLSEFITPYAETSLAKANMKYLGKSSETSIGSGYWFREKDADNNLRITNFLKVDNEGTITGYNSYTFSGEDGHVKSLSIAPKAVFIDDKNQKDHYKLKLENAVIKKNIAAIDEVLANPSKYNRPMYDTSHHKELVLDTTLTPNRVKAGQLNPERMSTIALIDYIQYRYDNHTSTERYMVALWRKVSYPFSLIVMMTLAAPIAFIQTRKGGVGAKIFLGIFMGICFYIINQLALNVGMLTHLPPWLTATLPSIIALMLAFTFLFFSTKTK